MKVALIHDYLVEYGGAERVLEVLHEMYPDAPVYTSFYFKDKMPKNFAEWDIRSSLLQKFPLHRFLRKPLIYAMPWAFEQFDMRDYDLIISSSSYASKGIIAHVGTTHVCYCHTPPRFVWGLPTRMRRNKLMKIFLGLFDVKVKLWDFAAAQRVDQFVANSKLVSERIRKFYKRESVVVYPPIARACLRLDNQATGESTLSHEEYYLVVSRLASLKNIDLIIRSCLRQNRRLKIVGRGDAESYLKSISDASIEFVGFVDNDTLARLYTNAVGLIVAAEDEDFGMTVVEAHSYGCPVLAYQGGGYLESVTEGVNGFFFNKLDNEWLDVAIHEFEAIKFDRSVIKHSAAKYSKENFVSEMKKVVAEAIKEKTTINNRLG